MSTRAFSRYCVPDMNYGLPVIGVANIGTTVGAMKYEQSLTKLIHLLRSSIPVTFSPLCHLYLSPLSLSCFLFLYISIFVVFSLYCLLSPFTCLYLALFLDLIFIFLQYTVYCICIYFLSHSVILSLHMLLSFCIITYLPVSLVSFNLSHCNPLLSICLML